MRTLELVEDGIRLTLDLKIIYPNPNPTSTNTAIRIMRPSNTALKNIQ